MKDALSQFRTRIAWKVLGGVDRLLAAGRPRPFKLSRLRRRERLRPDYRLVAASLMRHLEFESAFDVGCANGFLLSAFHKAGLPVAGIDISTAVRDAVEPTIVESVAVGDFSESVGRHDLVCCVEVAEHVEPQRSEELVATLCRLANRWIYFTAAPPGQRGYGHINCRPYDDWLAWFTQRGWALDPAMTAAVRQDLRSLRKAKWLGPNSFVLRPLPLGNGALHLNGHPRPRPQA